MRAVFVLVATSRLAVAQPSTVPSDFDACMARRRALTIEAMKVADPRERGRQLVAMPECRRFDDGTTEVVDPTAPPPPAQPFTRSATIALTAGFARSSIVYQLRPATSIGPFLELEGAWRLVRRFSVAAFGGYTGFRDDAYLGSYDVRHRQFDFGARIRLHLGAVSLGAGAGVEIDDAMPFADVPGYVDPLVLAGIDVKYEVARVDRFGFVVQGSLSYATTGKANPNDLSMYGDAVSVRLAVGFQR